MRGYHTASKDADKISSMTIYMETTTISAEETVGQIQRVLGRYGANAVQLDYQNGEVTAVYFKLEVSGNTVPFNLPCRFEPIYKVLYNRVKRFKPGTEENLRQQAKRVGWRQILKWIEAQMALIETHMVKMEEVFMPYIQVHANGQTLFEKIEAQKFKALSYDKG